MNAVSAWLTTPSTANDVFNPFGMAFLAVFGLGFVATAYLTGPGSIVGSRNPIQAAGLRHWASVGVAIFGTGLFFFLIRALQINPLTFGAPFWMVLSVGALLVATVRCLNWWRVRYPAELTRWQGSNR